MDRKEFLTLFGAGAAALLYTSCLTGCQATDNPVSVPTNVDFTIDLTSSLTKNGDSLVKSGVIVGRISATSFVAVSVACTHQGQPVVFQTSQFYCPSHGSSFSTSGAVTRGPANSALKQYKTTITGTSLRVFS
jgi:cytochrome b6-f complex iron-sulfur subunit